MLHLSNRKQRFWSHIPPVLLPKVNVVSFVYDLAQKGGEAPWLMADSHVGSLAIAFLTKNFREPIDS